VIMAGKVQTVREPNGNVYYTNGGVPYQTYLGAFKEDPNYRIWNEVRPHSTDNQRPKTEAYDAADPPPLPERTATERGAEAMSRSLRGIAAGMTPQGGKGGTPVLRTGTGDSKIGVRITGGDTPGKTAINPLLEVGAGTLGDLNAKMRTGDPEEYLRELAKKSAEEDTEEPVDPEEPTDPTDPEEPVEPTEPTDPTDPELPVEPTDPTDPETPVEPTDPTDPETPVEPETPPKHGPETPPEGWELPPPQDLGTVPDEEKYDVFGNPDPNGKYNRYGDLIPSDEDLKVIHTAVQKHRYH
jgi:hypothetical protein